MAAAIASREFEPRVRQAIVSRLSTSLESQVELGDIRLSFFPLRFRAESLTVRHHGRVGVPPLLVIQPLVVHLNLLDLRGRAVMRIATSKRPMAGKCSRRAEYSALSQAFSAAP